MATRAIMHRHEDSNGVQEWVETAPAPQLGPWVGGHAGYREEADAPVQRLETPSGGAVLVLSFGDPLTVSQQLTRVTAPTHPANAGVVRSFAAGISDRPTLTTHASRQHGAQVRLGPLAVYALFGVPLDELGRHTGGVVDLDDLGAGDHVQARWPVGDAGAFDRNAQLDRRVTRRASSPCQRPTRSCTGS